MAYRTAQVFATTVSVLCPYCGEPQPAPDNGADSWMPRQLKAAAQAPAARRACVACDKAFVIAAHTRVNVEDV